MNTQEWPANDYAIGSYIQASVNSQYLPDLDLSATDRVLDIGCGDGGFTKKILERAPSMSLLGVDASQNMLHLAKQLGNEFPNFSVQQVPVENMHFNNEFDHVVSFFCLQWATDIHQAFANIFAALKPGGKLLTVFPSGDDPYIMGYHALKKSGQFKSLDNFIAPVDYSQMNKLSDKLSDLGFSKLKVELHQQSIPVPSLVEYKKFVDGIAFYQGQVPDEEIPLINEAMLQYFANECKEKYQGDYRFNFTNYLITGVK
ncbi:MAG: methyltransferase domain-containing protein [Legionella sp.]|jgi:ubiquinone/menaquinone biosynthesis C-methylase UbiE